MPDENSGADQAYRDVLSSSRRNFLAGATALGLGALGTGSASASEEKPCDNPEGPWQDYDHSGDSLGQCSPLESIRTQNISVENLDLPSTYIVFAHDGSWHALQSSSQEIVYQSEDGGEVVNSALEDAAGNGNVRRVS